MNISIIMALYKEPINFIKDSIESTILSAECFDYEFIIVVDNPKIDSEVKYYLTELSRGNSRIKAIYNYENIGLALSLNKAIEISNGKYIMRMDADDICYQERVKVQKSYLDDNLDVGIVGSSVTRIDSDGNVIGISQSYNYQSDVKQSKDWKFRSICFHPTWLGRSEVFKSLKYNKLQCAQDVEFLFRCLESKVKVRNISEPLVYYRVSDGSLTLSKGFEQTMIRFFLNTVYTNHSDYLKLSNKIENLSSRRGYIYHAFSLLHNKYISSLNKKNYLMLLAIAIISPLHLYKLYLLIVSKFSG